MGNIVSFNNYNDRNKDEKTFAKVEEFVGFISNYMSMVGVILDTVEYNKELDESFNKLYKIIFPRDNKKIKSYSILEFMYLKDEYVKHKKQVEYINAIVGDLLNNITSTISSSTYSQTGFSCDKGDNAYFIELINNAIKEVNDVINDCYEEAIEVSRDDIRSDSIYGELNNVYLKVKMEGKLPYDIYDKQVEKVIKHISKKYSDIDINALKSLFYDTLISIPTEKNIKYDSYNVMKMKSILCQKIEDFNSKYSLYIDEEAYDLFDTIKEIVLNIDDISKLNKIEKILDYLLKINFILNDYPSCEIWQGMFLELAKELNNIFSNSCDLDIKKFIDYYMNLKNKYFNKIFIGSYIDPRKTEKEIRDGIKTRRR